MGLHMASGKSNRHIKQLQFPVTNTSYILIIISSDNKVDGASNCSVTVMDGINTQFWANVRIQDLHQ